MNSLTSFCCSLTSSFHPAHSNFRMTSCFLATALSGVDWRWAGGSQGGRAVQYANDTPSNPKSGPTAWEGLRVSVFWRWQSKRHCSVAEILMFQWFMGTKESCSWNQSCSKKSRVRGYHVRSRESNVEFFNFPQNRKSEASNTQQWESLGAHWELGLS